MTAEHTACAIAEADMPAAPTLTTLSSMRKDRSAPPPAPVRPISRVTSAPPHGEKRIVARGGYRVIGPAHASSSGDAPTLPAPFSSEPSSCSLPTTSVADAPSTRHKSTRPSKPHVATSPPPLLADTAPGADPPPVTVDGCQATPLTAPVWRPYSTCKTPSSTSAAIDLPARRRAARDCARARAPARRFSAPTVGAPRPVRPLRPRSLKCARRISITRTSVPRAAAMTPDARGCQARAAFPSPTNRPSAHEAAPPAAVAPPAPLSPLALSLMLLPGRRRPKRACAVRPWTWSVTPSGFVSKTITGRNGVRISQSETPHH